jgi:hypothetical protein
MSQQTGLFTRIGVIILCCFFESLSLIERSKCHFGYSFSVPQTKVAGRGLSVTFFSFAASKMVISRRNSQS